MPPHPPPLRRRFPFPSEGKAGALSAFGVVSGLIFHYAGKVENAQIKNAIPGSPLVAVSALSSFIESISVHLF